MSTFSNIIIKMCECGCGKPAPIASITSRKWGVIKGQPQRFIHGHNVPTGKEHPNFRPLTERFWEKVNKNGPLPSSVSIAIHPEIYGTQCWEWLGSFHPKGYGQIKDG